MPLNRRSPLLHALGALLLALPAACITAQPAADEPDATAPAPGADAGLALSAPPRTGFEPVADLLVESCGTLDCHGQAGRNLRLYGNHGLRLAASDAPGGKPTTPAEYQATYWSTVGLEPEVLDQVVRAGAAEPERLMFIRKARGLLNHKGGILTQPGDAFDQCLLQWIAGRTDPIRCEAAHPRRPGAIR